MSWEKVKLEDVCVSIADGDHQSLPLAEKGVPFIVIADITSNNRIDFKNARYVPTDYYDKLDQKRKAEKGDVLLTVKGSFGIPVYVFNDEPFVFQRDIAIFKCNERIEPLFLFYYMKNQEFYRYADSIAIGAAQRALTLKMLRDTVIKLPPLETQHRITERLSAYDDLIENNQKQIKLLEEAAQRLYKEWFVDLRFPGHETTPIINGIPEGWEYCKLGDVVKTSSGGTPSRSNAAFFENGSFLWLKTKELEDGFVFDTEEKITFDAIANSSAKEFAAGSIILAMYGATIGKLGIAAKKMTCNQACCVFDVSTFKYSAEFLFCWLIANREFMIQQGKGAAQPNLSQDLIKSFELLVPAENIRRMFSKYASSIFEKKKKLQKQIRLLSEARDRLLPKLMNGEIEV